MDGYSWGKTCMLKHTQVWLVGKFMFSQKNSLNFNYVFIQSRKISIKKSKFYGLLVKFLIIFIVKIYKKYGKSLGNQLPNNASSQKDLLQKNWQATYLCFL